MSKKKKAVETTAEEKITAKIKLDETGRCESVNAIYDDSDTVIEKEFTSESEAFEFYGHAQDYVYKDGEWILDPLLPEEPEPSPIDVLQAENKLLKAQVQALSDREEFQDDLIAELAMIAYA